eukprot:751825-Hanusia_phi.AAC.1
MPYVYVAETIRRNVEAGRFRVADVDDHDFPLDHLKGRKLLTKALVLLTTSSAAFTLGANSVSVIRKLVSEWSRMKAIAAGSRRVLIQFNTAPAKLNHSLCDTAASHPSSALRSDILSSQACLWQ